MFLIAIAFLVGSCAVHSASALPPTIWLIAPIACACIALFFRVHWCAALLFGVAWTWSHAAWRLADQLPTSPTPVDTVVTGYIASIVDVADSDAVPDAPNPGVRFAFDVVTSSDPVPRHIELTWYDTDQRPGPGELWQFNVRLRAPRGFANPGGVDYGAQQFRNGIGATGYIRENKKQASNNIRIESATWRYSVLQLRASIARRLRAAIGESRMLGIIQGLAVGETQNIDSQQWRVFANTGTTHLMAISGLHIGMVAALMAWIAGRIARRILLQKTPVTIGDIQAFVGIASAIAYSALAGFSVPTQRTLTMLIVYFSTQLLRRHIAVTHSLGLALIGVLLVDPFAPMSPGFWLSFGAVGAIFIALRGRIGSTHWSKEYLHIQLAVSVGLLPCLIGAFGSLSLISPLVNLVAIPVFTFVVVPLVLTGAMLTFISTTLSHWMLIAAARILEWTWPYLERASQLPVATWHFPQVPLWAALLAIGGCLLLIAPGMFATRAAGVMLCIPAALWHPQRPAAGAFELAMLDVGQGLAVVVTTSTHTLVYDTGPNFRSGRDTGQLVVLPYLHSRGVHKIDAMMISHGDSDHIGGAQSVRAGLDVRHMLLGPSIEMTSFTGSSSIEACHRGDEWHWDGVRFRVLHPSAEVPSKRRNDSSCVLLIEGDTGRALLLGDIERESEATLATNGDLKPVDVVIVPHHGSRTSSTAGLTEATRPKYALISAGFGNRWGFPKPEVVARWRESGATILKTETSGAIEVSIDAKGVQKPREYRLEHHGYWQKDGATIEVSRGATQSSK